MNNILPLLAIETSGELCSTALIFDEKTYVEMNYMQKHVHSKKLIEMIDVLMNSAGLTVKELGSIAISSGPGSFTGIRIGFSAGKGLAFGAGLPIIPVPTFDAYAYQISESLSVGTQFIIANKASSEDLYVSKSIVKENKFVVSEEVKVISSEKFPEFQEKIDIIFGNYSKREIYLKASSIGRWAYLFGKDLLTFDYDYLEPEYFGNPFLKKNRK